MDSMIEIVVEVEKYNIYKYIHTYIKKKYMVLILQVPMR